MKACLDLADTVESLGGRCDMETCAEKMKKKLSGSFSSLISSATRFGLIARKQGFLSTTDQYNKMKLSYTNEEKQEFLQNFFINMPTFDNIYSKYKNVKLPVDILDKALAKEFGVDKKLSKRISKYFIDGAKLVGLLNSDNTFKLMKSETEENKQLAGEYDSNAFKSNSRRLVVDEDFSGLDKFVVHVYGKGLNSKIEVLDSDDLSIVNAMINKIKKNLSFSDDNPAG